MPVIETKIASLYDLALGVLVKPVKLWCDAKGWTESLMNVVSAIESDVNKSASDSVIGERRADLLK